MTVAPERSFLEDVPEDIAMAYRHAYTALADLDTAIATVASASWSKNQGHHAWASMQTAGVLSGVILEEFERALKFWKGS